MDTTAQPVSPPVVGSGGSIPPRRIGWRPTAVIPMPGFDRREVALTLKKAYVRDGDDEVEKFEVVCDEADSKFRGDTPEAALRVAADAFEEDSDAERLSLDFDDAAVDPEPSAV